MSLIITFHPASAVTAALRGIMGPDSCQNDSHAPRFIFEAPHYALSQKTGHYISIKRPSVFAILGNHQQIHIVFTAIADNPFTDKMGVIIAQIRGLAPVTFIFALLQTAAHAASIFVNHA